MLEYFVDVFRFAEGIPPCEQRSTREEYVLRRVQRRILNFSLVVLYRDGVSDGQLAIVAEHELPQIIDTFPKIMPGYQ